MGTCRFRRKLYAPELDATRRFLEELLNDPDSFDTGARTRLSAALGGAELEALMRSVESILDTYVAIGIDFDFRRLRSTGILYAKDKDRTYGSIDELLPMDGSTAAKPRKFTRSADVTDDIAYRSYFATFIDPPLVRQDGRSSTGIEAFFVRYPLLRHAVTTSANHFQHNLKLACARVARDWNDIELAMFPQAKLDRLLRIETTGNDFHKGGKQVLILTFKLRDGNEGKVVYKPSAVEIDCRLVGDSTTANRVAPQGYHQDASLSEIVNGLVKPAERHGPGFSGLPTYRILPYNRSSVSDSYGYIEFLEHGPAVDRTARFPDSLAQDVSAALTNSNVTSAHWITDDPAIVDRFFYTFGALLAVAMSVSLCDLHVQNVIVHRYVPHLIDLEEALKRPMSEMKDTLLTSVLGRVDDPGNTEFAVQNDQTPALSVGAPAPPLTPSTAVLYFRDAQGQAAPAGLTPRTRQWLVWGAADVFDAFASDDGHASVVGWVGSLRSVIARFVTRGTREYAANRRELFHGYCHNRVDQLSDDDKGFDAFSFQPIGAPSQHFFRTAVTSTRKLWTKSFTGPGGDQWTCPFWALEHKSHVWRDYFNCDVPSFYHLLGSDELLNSAGDVVDVAEAAKWQAANISYDIDDFDAFSQARGRLNRSTYFPESPVAMVIRQLTENQAGYRADPAAFLKTALGDLIVDASTIAKQMRSAAS